MATTTALVQRLKDEGQDFEWYPTTNEIIQLVKSRCERRSNREEDDVWDSVLDCGAGDGRVLSAITTGSKYAIEKAVPLIQAMPHHIILIGTEFFQSTLIDKPVDVVFSNPPYSEYEAWATKIIMEAHARKIFLVIPTRWKNSPTIQSAIKKRGDQVSVEVLGTFDFLNAERAARAEVDVLEISLIRKDRFGDYSRAKSDPFDVWFDTEFDFKEKIDTAEDDEEDRTLRGRLEKAVVNGKGKVEALVELYNHEMGHLYENFKQISRLDPDLLQELGTNKSAISGALKLRITGLKNKYWQELFENLEDIKSRLTSKSRKSMLEKLTAQTNVDFTETNIYGVLIWVIKNANYYYDQQLIDIVQEMVSTANIYNYKSNERILKFDHWRYQKDNDLASHFGLELRIILHRYSAIESGYRSWDYRHGLSEEAHTFLNDIITIAKNLNFPVPEWESTYNVGTWTSGATKEIYCNRGKDKFLMTIRAFKNGNLHIKFYQAFIRRLNVEFGRLKGWLKDASQAAEELNIPVEEAKAAFDSNRQITMSNMKLLTVDSVKSEKIDPDPPPPTPKKKPKNQMTFDFKK